MNEAQALQEFLSRALGRRRERYLQFVGREKSRGKFLAAICHDLEWDLDANKSVKSLPARVLDCPGFLFESPKRFGEPLASMRELVESPAESCLGISTDGLAGVYCPESFIDSRMFFCWK